MLDEGGVPPVAASAAFPISVAAVFTFSIGPGFPVFAAITSRKRRDASGNPSKTAIASVRKPYPVAPTAATMMISNTPLAIARPNPSLSKKQTTRSSA